MTILVTGATGNVGRNVVDLLSEAGVPIRATSRNPKAAGLPPGVDVRAADFKNPETFGDALTGVEKVFLFPNPSGVEGLIEVAKAAGVKRVVLLSSMAVLTPEPHTNPIAWMHLIIEQALERSGLEWTFVRPGAFATNTLQWAQAIRAGDEVRIAYAEGNVSPIHELDIAAVAAQALLTEGHVGAKYAITGPESLTQRRQAELIGAAIGRSMPVVDLTGDEAHAQVAKQFGGYGPPGLVDTVLASLADGVGKPAEVTETVERVTGRPARTYAEWAVNHKADFTG